MLKKALSNIFTEFLFALIAILTLVSIGLVMDGGLQFTYVAVLVFGLNVWAVAKSDLEGFFRQRGMPRAGDPERQFHPIQNVLLVILMMLQVAFVSYAILAADPSGLGPQPSSNTIQPSF